MARNRNFCFTLNNYTDEQISLIQNIDCRYLIYGKEIGQQGTPHLQGYIHFENARFFAAIKKLFPNGVHIEECKGNSEQNIEYCSKSGDVWEKGDRPVSQKRKGEMEKQRWEDAYKAAKIGDLDDIPYDMRTRFYRTYKEIAKDNMTKPPDLDNVCGEWYYGPAGTGKTTKARMENPGAYIKSRDKWWDGYQGEDVVIMDDMDLFCKSLSGSLKDWADKWTFKAEVKGSFKWIRPKKFIVTSQYHVDQIFEDSETREALSRRYNFVFFSKC